MRQVCVVLLALAGLTILPATASAQLELFGPPMEQPAPSGPSIVVLDFNAPVLEKPGATDPIFGNANSESLQSLIARMDLAVGDDDVKAVAITLGGGSFGYGQLAEIRSAIDRLKAADIPVYAHADSLTTSSFALLCGADRLSVTPTGDVWVTGLYSEGMYLRGLLDLVGAQADFLAMGDYKTAAEQFTRSGPSPAAQEMQNWIYDSMFESLIDLIATGRDVDADQARSWIDQGLFSADAAMDAGLIDVVEHRQDFSEALYEVAGKNVRLDRSYGVEEEAELDFAQMFAEMSPLGGLLGGPMPGEESADEDAIAVIYVDGPIMLGAPTASALGAVSAAYSEPIRRALDAAADDDSVKAVVLRVNSPGGSATASEVILNATNRVAANKPFVVSMGDVAGSGGYYVACGSDYIFADPMTMTGSIGVVGGKVVTTNMWNKVGINFHATARGNNADILSSSNAFSDSQREQMTAWMDEVYGTFKQHVVDARGDLLAKPIDELAGGRVYTGAQALELGLVDEMGGLDNALAHVAERAGIDDYDVRVMPESTGFLEQLLDSFLGGGDEDDPRLQIAAPGAGVSGRFLEEALPVLKGADPYRVRILQNAALQLSILEQERVVLAMPLYLPAE